MLLRKIYLLALGVVCLSIAACSHGPSNSNYIVLSYYERPGNCEDCPVFQVHVHSGGDVDFHGLRGCAVRGSPFFGPKISLLKVDRCLQYIVDRSLLLGLWEL